MNPIHRDQEAIERVSDFLFTEGIYIGKSTVQNKISVLYMWKDILVEVVYEAYRSKIAYVTFPSHYNDYERYLPTIDRLVNIDGLS